MELCYLLKLNELKVISTSTFSPFKIFINIFLIKKVSLLIAAQFYVYAFFDFINGNYLRISRSANISDKRYCDIFTS